MANMSSTGTVNISQAMMVAAVQAIDTYQSAISGLNGRLQSEIDGLIPSSFSGSAAQGFKAFYDNNIFPNIGENLTKMLAGASEQQLEIASEYAFRLGLAFQIIDDILDVTSTAEELGKPIGSDSEENKTTFVTLYGVDRAKEIASEITEEAMEYLGKIENNSFLVEMTEMLLRRTK